MSAPIKLRGFTLIELMVVIAIIAILSTVGIVVYSSAQKSGRISKRIQDLNAIKQAIEIFRSANGKFPIPPQPGIFVCLSALSGANSLTPNYMPLIPDDPLGSSFCYQYTSANTGADYKARTNPAILSTEMGPTEYKTQPSLIDPARDGTDNDGCVITTTGSLQTGWSVQNGTAVSCELNVYSGGGCDEGWPGCDD